MTAAPIPSGLPVPGLARTEAIVDLGAIAANVRTLAGVAPTASVMAVLKADAYGHGAVPVAQAALAGGATWLGVAFPSEAAPLRAAGITAPILAWLLTPGEDLTAPITTGVDLGVSSLALLEAVIACARSTGTTARIHLEVDTGLSRGGATAADWLDLVGAAAAAQAEGSVHVAGVWSHLANADVPGDAVNDKQLDAFHSAVADAAAIGVRPDVLHLANSGATLSAPRTHFDLVRTGIAVYGLTPGRAIGTARSLGLVPAMTLLSHVALAKRVPAGSGVSYGHRYTTDRETTLALAPLGYADGIPRHATNVAEVLLGGKRRRIAGTVCMDQFVLDVGDDDVAAGDPIVVFGPGADGEPTADEWADALGTIGYEIVTRIGARTPRTYRPVSS
ncbi:MAG: alanine racemase [Frankiaceae bacterium]|nr:alanine racemase [Frankiaceae bacterium]